MHQGFAKGCQGRGPLLAAGLASVPLVAASLDRVAVFGLLFGFYANRSEPTSV